MGKNLPPPPPPNKNRLKAALDLSDNSADRNYGDDDIRGGCRGGRADFTWDTVKADKQRNMYLGNSVRANIWRSARPSNWYESRIFNEGTESMSREERKREEETVARITQRFGYGALCELTKYKALLDEEEKAIPGARQNENANRSTRVAKSSLKDDLRRERQNMFS